MLIMSSTVSFLRKNACFPDFNRSVMVGEFGPNRRLMNIPSHPLIALWLASRVMTDGCLVIVGGARMSLKSMGRCSFVLSGRRNMFASVTSLKNSSRCDNADLGGGCRSSIFVLSPPM